MAAVATRAISHAVLNDKGKIVRTITFAKGDVIHDDDLHELLKQSHHHSLSPVEHTQHYAPPAKSSSQLPMKTAEVKS